MQASKRPDVLLFDLGGVLVENVGFERLNALLASPLPLEEVKARWLSSPAVRSFEAGSCSPEVFARDVVAEWRIALGPDSFLEAFTSWPKGLYAGAGELLASLRDRYVLACLSNSNEVHWRRFDGFRQHFHISLSSHLLGAVKPDRECFRLALHACNATAGQVAFFDDSLANVLAAQALGIASVHVDGFAALQRSLAAKGWQ